MVCGVDGTSSRTTSSAVDRNNAAIMSYAWTSFCNPDGQILTDQEYYHQLSAGRATIGEVFRDACKGGDRPDVPELLAGAALTRARPHCLIGHSG